jgi:hypothetical protein
MKLKLTSPVPWQKIFLRKENLRKGMLFSDNTCILFGCRLLVCIESWSYTSSKNEQLPFQAKVLWRLYAQALDIQWIKCGVNMEKIVSLLYYIYNSDTIFFHIYITVTLFFPYWPYILFIEHLVPVLYVTCKETNCKF